ncbi:hypothetical protein ABBQ38_008239 [Trebouxia sp. C0009 RCD-2024]
MGAALSAADLKRGHLICLLTGDQRVVTADWNDDIWDCRLGENAAPVHADGLRLPTIPPEAVFLVDRKGPRGPLGFRSLTAPAGYLQAQKESQSEQLHATASQPMAFGEHFDSWASWELNATNKLVNCAKPRQEFGFQFRRLFAVPRDEIMQPAPAPQCLQQHESSLILHPSAIRGSEDAAISSMLKYNNIVCLYNAALEQVAVNQLTGELSHHRPLVTGLDGLHEFPAKLLFQIHTGNDDDDADGGRSFRLTSLFSLREPTLRPSRSSPDALVCADISDDTDIWVRKPVSVSRWLPFGPPAGRPQIVNMDPPHRALGLKMRQVCFVEKETFLADQKRNPAAASHAKLLKYRDLLLESSKKQQLLDSALAKLDVEQAKTTKLQRQQAQREAEYAEIQQELIRTQESKASVEELQLQAAASAQQLAAKQTELTAMGKQLEIAQQLAQEAEAAVALLEAKIFASQSREQQRAEVQEAESAKLLPWSPAMASLFIDPSKLNQGSLLAPCSSEADSLTYSGTYNRTDGSQPIQVALKMLDLPGQAGRGGFEEQVRKVWQTSTDSHHICRMYGVSCIDGHPCLVMKLYPHSLAQEMSSTSGRLDDKRKLPIRMVVQWGVGICQGLQDFHAAGIIMRNLSQASVLITSGGTAVLAGPSLSQDCPSGDAHHPDSEYKWVTCLLGDSLKSYE